MLVSKEKLFQWYHVEKLSYAEIAERMGLEKGRKSLQIVDVLLHSYKIERRCDKRKGETFKEYWRKKRKVMRDGERNKTREGKGIYIPDDATAEGTRHVQGGQSGAGNQTEA
jgi:hypothetical protein